MTYHQKINRDRYSLIDIPICSIQQSITRLHTQLLHAGQTEVILTASQFRHLQKQCPEAFDEKTFTFLGFMLHLAEIE